MSLLDQIRRRKPEDDSEQTLMDRLEEIRQKAVENDLGATGRFSPEDLEGTAPGIEVVELEVDDATLQSFMAEALLSGSSLSNITLDKEEEPDPADQKYYERTEQDPWEKRDTRK